MTATYKSIWVPVLECDDEEGNHTCYSLIGAKRMFGTHMFISQKSDGMWDVEYKIPTNPEYTVVKRCATKLGAVHWFDEKFMEGNDDDI